MTAPTPVSCDAGTPSIASGASGARAAATATASGRGGLRGWARHLVPQDARQLPTRLVQLLVGLLLYGVSDGLLLLAGLGVDPWDVLHQGIGKHLHLAVGTVVIIVGVLVLLLWIPLRQRPGIGTLSNVVLIGVAINATLAWGPHPHTLAMRVPLMVFAIVLNGVATGCYIGAGLGPGPRDGLMTGFAARGHSIRVVRTGIELGVLAAGWLLGGSVGVGTVCYAAGIGPLAHVFIPLLSRDRRGCADRGPDQGAGRGPSLARRRREAARCWPSTDDNVARREQSARDAGPLSAHPRKVGTRQPRRHDTEARPVADLAE